MSERQHAKALMQWVALEARTHPELRLLFHTPNEAADPWRRIDQAAQGANPGVPDYLLPVPRGEFHGLAIELKAPGGRLTAVQTWWLDQLRRQGWSTHVAHGWESARDCLLDYLNLEPARMTA